MATTVIGEGACSFSLKGRLDSHTVRQHTFASDEGDELAHALLHTLFGFLCNLGVIRKGVFHNAGHWSKVANVSIRSIGSLRP